MEYSQYIKSKYDFYDEAARFFYNQAVTLFETRSQSFDKNAITTFMAESEDRLRQYQSFKGWSTLSEWMKLSIPDNFKNYFDILKKYSLLREYQRNGFAVEKIMKHRRFEEFTAHDIYRLIRSKADRIHTVILTNEEAEVLNSNIQNTLLHCMQAPDMGVQLPYPIQNDLFRGAKRKSTMAVGMLSNAGKSLYGKAHCLPHPCVERKSARAFERNDNRRNALCPHHHCH